VHQDVLDHLHILANYEWDSRPLMTLILKGLPELWDRMLLRRNRSLWSRVRTRLRLSEPQPKDTVAYVGHRLRLAGCEREAFTSNAMVVLHEASGERLRDIDRIATAALKITATTGHRLVDRAIVVNVAHAHQR
jgi:general secretion pathway protein A